MIAVLVPVCSRNQTYSTLEDTPLVKRLLPSLKKTMSLPYQLQIGQDDDDAFYSQHHAELESLGSVLRLTGCQHAPARAWNQLAALAQKSTAEYFFQVGDDVVMETPGWDTAFVQELQEHNHRGVVGPCNPVNHGQRTRAGKPAVIENSMVHRTHLEIFGTFFHPQIANWQCDDWISRVQDPWFSRVHTDYLCSNTIIDCRYRIQACPELQAWIQSGREKVAAHAH